MRPRAKGSTIARCRTKHVRNDGRGGIDTSPWLRTRRTGVSCVSEGPSRGNEAQRVGGRYLEVELCDETVVPEFHGSGCGFSESSRLATSLPGAIVGDWPDVSG